MLIIVNVTFKSLASDKEPESCRAGGDICVEALTGLCECQVLSLGKLNSDVSPVKECEGQHRCDRQGEITGSLTGSETLSEHTSDNLRENREILCLTQGPKPKVRIVKLKGKRR